MPQNDAVVYLGTPEVARKWNVSGWAIRRMIRNGTLPALKTPSGRYLIHRDDAVLRPVVPQ